MYSPVLCNSWIPYMLRQGNNSRKRPLPSGSQSGRARKRQKVSASEYKSVPAAVSLLSAPSREPRVNSRGSSRTTVSHRELVSTIVGSASFTASSFAVNPGMSATFPWLSSMASNFESYEIKSMSFDYEPVVGTSSNGAVYMALDYDAADGTPSTLSQMMTYHGAVRGPVWSPIRVPLNQVDSGTLGRRRYLRSAALAVNLDIKNYDLANIFVATSGGSGSQCGEVYVTYVIDLITPQSGGASSTLNAPTDYGKVVSGGTVSQTAIFGDAAVVTGTVSVAAAANTLTFNRIGIYDIYMDVAGTGSNPFAGLTGTAKYDMTIAATTIAGPLYRSYGRVVVSAIGQTAIFATLASCTGTSTRIIPSTGVNWSAL